MNRVIKFRAWDKENKKLYSCDYLQFAIGGIRFLTLINDKQNVIDLKDDGYELMQFTGLTDKNGEEIYEGDIVKIKDGEMVGLRMGEYGPEEDYRDLIVPVYYDGSSFGYLHPNGDCHVPLDYDIANTIAIGNIYENPELLEP